MSHFVQDAAKGILRKTIDEKRLDISYLRIQMTFLVLYAQGMETLISQVYLLLSS